MKKLVLIFCCGIISFGACESNSEILQKPEPEPGNQGNISKEEPFLRKFKARMLDALPNAIQNAFHAVTVSDCSGWFRFCGYAL